MRPAVRVAGAGGARRDRAPRSAAALPEEAAVAMVYDGSTQAVLMATPRGSRGLRRRVQPERGHRRAAGEIESLEVVPQAEGIEVRMWLAGDRSEALAARRRFMTGPVGCGLCGLDSLGAALRPVPG